LAPFPQKKHQVGADWKALTERLASDWLGDDLLYCALSMGAPTEDVNGNEFPLLNCVTQL